MEQLIEVMRKPIKKSDNITWDTAKLIMPGIQLTVWSHEDGMPFPNLNEGPDPDDLCPESDVTKQFWINLYDGIERWHQEKKFY